MVILAEHHYYTFVFAIQLFPFILIEEVERLKKKIIFIYSYLYSYLFFYHQGFENFDIVDQSQSMAGKA